MPVVTHCNRELLLDDSTSARTNRLRATPEAVTIAGIADEARAAFLAPAGLEEHPGDQAYRVVRQWAALEVEAVSVLAYGEPDFVQAFPFPRPATGCLQSFARTRARNHPRTVSGRLQAPSLDGRGERWPPSTPGRLRATGRLSPRTKPPDAQSRLWRSRR
jgi:hypothetical protein